MKRSLATCFAITCALSVPYPASAQDTVAASETRVRLVAPSVSEKPLKGRLLQTDDSTLTVLRDSGDTLTLPRDSVTRFERSVGPSRRKLGAGIGALVGLATANVLGLAYCGDDSLCDDQTGAILLSSLITVPLGALLGRAVSPGERWAEQDPKQVRIGVTAVPRGIGIGLSLGF